MARVSPFATGSVLTACLCDIHQSAKLITNRPSILMERGLGRAKENRRHEFAQAHDVAEEGKEGVGQGGGERGGGGWQQQQQIGVATGGVGLQQNAGRTSRAAPPYAEPPAGARCQPTWL